MAKQRIIGVRVDEEQSAQFERAAKAVGKSVSEWMRGLGAREIAPPDEYEVSPVLEHAAKAEPGFGKSVTEFLLEKEETIRVPGSGGLTGVYVTEPDSAEEQCLRVFGEFAVLKQAPKYIPKWAQMTWEQRYEALKSRKEAEA